MDKKVIDKLGDCSVIFSRGNVEVCKEFDMCNNLNAHALDGFPHLTLEKIDIVNREER